MWRADNPCSAILIQGPLKLRPQEGSISHRPSLCLYVMEKKDVSLTKTLKRRLEDVDVTLERRKRGYQGDEKEDTAVLFFQQSILRSAQFERYSS